METPEQREQQELVQRQLKRAKVIEQYKEQLDEMRSRRGKGIKYRRWWVDYVRKLSSVVFQTEEKEYEHIGKPGRRFWTSEQDLKKSFTKEDGSVIGPIVFEFGCFDY
jgi:hypothetical protein